MATRITRTERKARTRDELLLAARSVFLRRGFHGASLDEIAEEAGYTKGAVYSNFAGKDDLYLALLDAHYGRRVAAYVELLLDQPTFEDAIRAVGRFMVESDAQDPDWLPTLAEFVAHAGRDESSDNTARARAVPARDRRCHRNGLRRRLDAYRARAAPRGRPGVVGARPRLQRRASARSGCGVVRDVRRASRRLHAWAHGSKGEESRMTAVAATSVDPLAPATLGANATALLQRDRWSREQLVDHQRDRLRGLIRHAVERSPYYRAALGGRGVGGLSDLPTLPKRVLMEHFDRIVTNRRLRLPELETFLARADAGALFLGEYRIFSTAGTTGVPGLFVYSQQDFARWVSVCIRSFARLGMTPETRIVGVGAPSSLHLSQQVIAAMQAGRRRRVSVTTPRSGVVHSTATGPR
jgi:AcrR family transcriptional regulator